MPNHITNLVTVTGPAEQVDAFRVAHVKQEERGPCFDFDTIVPKPKSVKDTERGWEPGQEMVGDAAVEHYARALLCDRYVRILPSDGVYHMPPTVITWRDLIAHYDRAQPSVAKWAKARLICAAETGHPGWYEWSCAMWGTKWGAYQYKERSRESGRFVFEFQTAWSVPEPILDKLADIWPELTIETESIDEGGGEYVGRYHGAERSLERAPDDDARYRRVYGEDRAMDDDDATEDAPSA